ncbi:MAG: nitrite reductase [Phycisphaerae bacterium]|nr:nitrite reductase [Phycisphaerae bacterium]NIW48950.1 nitrite reductase [Gammaproteobacteria bacterium]NIX01230.1 nitrite reductase [Phycisphaerae bacterium]NIX27893.1 nitrite reductase [Phycisphaerae bacterium]
MREIDITSGRQMHLIDPHLTVWGWEIPLYLFIGGLVSGILFFSALYFIRGKTEEMHTVVRLTPLFTPILLGIGLFALFLDLEYKLHVFRFYTNIRLESPMSWGSWTLAVIFPLSIIWSAIHVEKVFPRWQWPYRWMKAAVSFFQKYARVVAWIMIIYALLLGMYTGILLSAFNARPFWNTSILGPLFLVSGFSTGVALNLLFSKSEAEKHLLTRIDIMAIGVELFLIVHMFMGFLASTQVHIEAANLFLGGPFTAEFWVLVVGIGLLFPALVEVLELNGKVIITKIPALLVLFGGLILRFVIVEAGQISQWVY